MGMLDTWPDTLQSTLCVPERHDEALAFYPHCMSHACFQTDLLVINQTCASLLYLLHSCILLLSRTQLNRECVFDVSMLFFPMKTPQSGDPELRLGDACLLGSPFPLRAAGSGEFLLFQLPRIS